MSVSILAVTAGTTETDRPQISPFVAEQVRALNEAGARVELAAIKNRMSIRTSTRCVREFRDRVRKQNIDLVHAHYGSMVSMIGLASKANARYVVSFGGSDLLGVPFASAYWRVRETVSYALSVTSAIAADAVIVKSEGLLDSLPTRVHKKAVVMPNGVNLTTFSPRDRMECRQILGWDAEAPIVLFNGSTGSNVHVKNYRLADQAVGEARRILPDVRLVMTGNDPAELVPTMLNAADCLIVTSLHEGSPNIVKEAMACNLPVVTVPCGDVRSRLTSAEVGRVCPYDAKLLGEALIDYLRSGRRSTGRTALQSQGLDSATVASRMIELFQTVIG